MGSLNVTLFGTGLLHTLIKNMSVLQDQRHDRLLRYLAISVPSTWRDNTKYHQLCDTADPLDATSISSNALNLTNQMSTRPASSQTKAAVGLT